jgi:uncharacterized protein YdeI (YjbR/CyaY-like superfamily)
VSGSPESVEPEPIELPDQAAWERWLEQNHAVATSVWLKLAKKGAPRTTVQQADAVDSAICFGWIDGQIRGLDEHYYRQRFTPRRRRSRWSLINTQRVARLSAEGRMRPAGLAEVRAAEEDGRSEAAYSQANDEIPEDLAAAIAANPEAQRFFETLSSQNRFALIFRLTQPGSPATRARRIDRFVAMLAEGRSFHS